MPCSLCKELNKPHNNMHKINFEREVNEGMSVRDLVILLKGMGIKTSRSTVNLHIRKCMGVKRKNPIFERILPSLKREEKQVISKCPYCSFLIEWKDKEGIHVVNLPQRFVMETEKVHSYCPQCLRILDEFGVDPEQNEKPNRRHDEALYWSLRR